MWRQLGVVIFVFLLIVLSAEHVRSSVVIAIPTVPRHRLLPDEVAYLVTSLEAWKREIIDANIKLVVVSRSKHDDAFVTASKKYKDQFDFVDFETSEASIMDISAEDVKEIELQECVEEQRARPPIMSRIQRQAVDLAKTMRVASNLRSSYKYFVLIEDDFIPCPNFAERLRILINEAGEKHGDWFSIRISFGSTGIVLKNGRDVIEAANYVEVNRARRPPDHLLVEFVIGETAYAAKYKNGRPHLAYRFNALEHIGSASTIRVQRDHSPYVSCWEPLNSSVLFPSETCKQFLTGDICSPS